MADLKHSTVKMRKLLMKDTSFHFSDKIVEEEFKACKKKITQMTNLAPFDPNLECILLTNASKLYGLAFILIQKKASGKGYHIVDDDPAHTRIFPILGHQETCAGNS